MAISKSPNNFKLLAANAVIASRSVKCMIASNSFTPNEDSTNFRSNVTEVTGAGYTAGGVAVTAVASVDLTANTGTITFGSANFGTVSIANIKHFIYYFDTGTPSTSEIIRWITLDPGEEQAVTNTPFNVPSNTLSFA
jgi:hypothetical protein